MPNLQTRIRFSRVITVKSDVGYSCKDAIAIIASSEEFTIEELSIIAVLVPELIRNRETYEDFLSKLQERVKKMRRPNTTAIQYMNLLRKIQGLEYKIV